MPNALTPEQVQKIADALASGQKILAIKLHREATGAGLKESKDFIEALIPKLKEQDPQRFANISTSPGCGTAVLIGALAVTALVCTM